jgi:HK97 family phage portal protein
MSKPLGHRVASYLGGMVAEFRSSLENPQTPLSMPAEWLLDIFNGGRTDAGIRVSEMTALQVTTVFACVNLICSAVGFLPFHIFELIPVGASKRVGKRLAFDHDLYDLLRYEPNEEMTAITFRKTLQAHLLLWSNCYAEVVRDNGNRPTALLPRNPYRTKPYRVGRPTEINGELVPAGGLIFKTTDGIGDMVINPEDPPAPGSHERMILAADMLHIPGLALDGRVAPSTIWLARQAVGLALGAEKFGAKFFGNSARPGGILEHPGKLSNLARENITKSWQEATGGENVHRPKLLEEGMKWTQIATNPNDAQFLETRQFQRSELCSIFLVPPHMVGDQDKTNRANVEQIGLEFVTFTLGPWLEAWEQETRRKLFPKTGRSSGRFFPKFETRKLTMPDAASRQSFYNSGKQWGWLSSNDILELEDRNPVDSPAADALWMPINMQEMGAQEDPNEDLADEQAERSANRIAKAYFRLFRDAFGRICSRRNPGRDDFRRAFLPVLWTVAEAVAGAGYVDPLGELAGSVADYSERLQERAEQWRQANGDADKVAERELLAAIAFIQEQISKIGTEVQK